MPSILQVMRSNRLKMQTVTSCNGCNPFEWCLTTDWPTPALVNIASWIIQVYLGRFAHTGIDPFFGNQFGRTIIHYGNMIRAGDSPNSIIIYTQFSLKTRAIRLGDHLIDREINSVVCKVQSPGLNGVHTHTARQVRIYPHGCKIQIRQSLSLFHTWHIPSPWELFNMREEKWWPFSPLSWHVISFWQLCAVGVLRAAEQPQRRVGYLKERAAELRRPIQGREGLAC